jgi:hypothetical protein
MTRPFRHELKFVVHHGVKTLLLERWRRYLVRAPFTNEHATTPILSQYFDSPDFRCYVEKLDGIAVRNKVRLRVYAREFRAGVRAFLEIKHRQNDRVKKHRQQFEGLDPTYLDPINWDAPGSDVGVPFRVLNEKLRLRPSAQVYYQREAYEGAVEADVRVTFDTNLMGLYPGEKLSSRVARERSRYLMPDTLAILEVKATGRLPNWLREGVLAGELQQQTIPKYVTAVEVLRLAELGRAGVYV